MIKLCLVILCVMCAAVAQAKHIIGGQMYFTFVSNNGNNYTYRVTLKLYRTCERGEGIAEMPPLVDFAVFDKTNNSWVRNFRVNRSSFRTSQLTQFDPCIVNPPPVCFQIGTYETDITVPLNGAGYTVAFQSCCRDNFMVNIVSEPIPGDPRNLGTGATYFTDLPGSNNGPGNSSPVFNNEEATLVCADKKFRYDFSARDAQGDSLVYEFCDAYKGGRTTDQSGIPPPATNPPYSFVTYTTPYSGGSPLGPGVTINRTTGIIAGVSPPAGKYVVTVCVKEYRRGQLINTLRKDFHLNVTTCVKLVTAAMPEKYADCNSYTINFLNTSTPGKQYIWDFGDGTGDTTTSASPLPHTYRRPGTYTVKLFVDKNSSCGDSAIAIAHVYPFFRPGFAYAGRCVQKETVFSDLTRTDIGRTEYYKWDFGTGDTTNVPNPQYQFKTPGTYNVKLYVRTNMGCERTIDQDVVIYDKPPVNATADTLLCVKDSLRLWAASELPGTYRWTPDNYRIMAPNTATPLVFPQRDTTYTVTFTDAQGCTNENDVFIDIRDTLLVKTNPDSTVCTGDPVTLRAVTDGAYTYRWIHLGTQAVLGTADTVRITPAPPRQQYAVEVRLGSCNTRDSVALRVVDPPRPAAAPDTTICHGDKVTLRATGGAYYRWSPSYSIDEPERPITTAQPTDTTTFIVTVTDTLGCPKPVTADAKVNVVPPVRAFAGNDTIVIRDQPFQLHATGGVRYVWTPVSGLNNPNIYNPVTTANRAITYTVTAYTQEGCKGSDNIFIRFITGPDIYIPTAFSPNGDGMNDIFRPIPVGMVQMDFFRVFDRWGKLMYSNTAYMEGWDGTVNGQPAAVGTYVWVVQGKNINNEIVLHKGTVTLVR